MDINIRKIEYVKWTPKEDKLIEMLEAASAFVRNYPYGIPKSMMGEPPKNKTRF